MHKALIFLRFPYSFRPPLPLPSSKIFISIPHTSRQRKHHSQKYNILPLAALLLRHIPLNLPSRRGLWVRGMLQRSSNLPLPLHTEHPLSYAVIHLSELAASNFGADHILQLDCREFQLICIRSSVRSGSPRVLINVPIRES